MGQEPSDDELFQMMSEVDEDMTGIMSFVKFIQIIQNLKARSLSFEDDSDIVDAFVACGIIPFHTTF